MAVALPDRDDGARPWSAGLGGQLKAARLRASLSRSAVADRMRVSPESVRRWEQGGSRPSTLAVRAYLAAVGAEDLELVEDGPEATADPGLEVGAAVRRRRQELGLTQVEAAARLGVAQPTLAGWEIGRARPGRELADVIARFLDQPVGEVEQLLHQPLTVEMSSWPTFGRILGERRLDLQLDRAELAAQLHVSPRTVAAWELGDKSPNNSHLRRLSEVLGVEVTVLVSALPEPRPPTELGRLIHRRQRFLGLTQDQLALAAGVGPVTVGRWTWGRHVPTDSNVAGLARALEVDERLVRAALELDLSR